MNNAVCQVCGKLFACLRTVNNTNLCSECATKTIAELQRELARERTRADKAEVEADHLRNHIPHVGARIALKTICRAAARLRKMAGWADHRTAELHNAAKWSEAVAEEVGEILAILDAGATTPRPGMGLKGACDAMAQKERALLDGEKVEEPDAEEEMVDRPLRKEIADYIENYRDIIALRVK